MARNKPQVLSTIYIYIYIDVCVILHHAILYYVIVHYVIYGSLSVGRLGPRAKTVLRRLDDLIEELGAPVRVDQARA